ncbi:GL14034 [Drosophila persimilis]|uniref:GL14034 n=1 Tax=Drosophila persimilis TaxID=7234 RepID=B4GNJ7_DROPE|nr:GL14034 [Drosophila persimilis]
MSKLETDSDSSEEFFDAEDTTPNRHSTLCRRLPAEVAQEFIFPEPAVRVNAAASSDSDATPIGAGTPATRSPTNSLGARLKQQPVVFAEPKPVHGAYGRQRFRELRQCMQNDEDDNPGNTLTPDSQVFIFANCFDFSLFNPSLLIDDFFTDCRIAPRMGFSPIDPRIRSRLSKPMR